MIAAGDGCSEQVSVYHAYRRPARRFRLAVSCSSKSGLGGILRPAVAVGAGTPGSAPDGRQARSFPTAAALRAPGEDSPDCSEAMAVARLPALFEDGRPAWASVWADPGAAAPGRVGCADAAWRAGIQIRLGLRGRPRTGNTAIVQNGFEGSSRCLGHHRAWPGFVDPERRNHDQTGGARLLTSICPSWLFVRIAAGKRLCFNSRQRSCSRRPLQGRRTPNVPRAWCALVLAGVGGGRWTGCFVGRCKR
jgi:hypothetical protein